VIAEPVIGGGGVFPAPEGYWERLREICDRYEALLIADEVITGFGRTGKLFGFEHAGIVPDIITVAKGITSAYLPLAAAVATERVFQIFQAGESDEAKFTQVSTFGGHPASCAAALANLDILVGERLWENAARMGNYLLEALRAIHSPFIGEVRGRGLLIGLEMVESQDTRAPLPEAAAAGLQRAIRDAGVIVGRNSDTVPGFCNVLILSPPLTLSREQADTIVEALEAGLAQVH
jgi:adenosylmethionine-8-amino-7-oxononanoate aminotransferase